MRNKYLFFHFIEYYYNFIKFNIIDNNLYITYMDILKNMFFIGLFVFLFASSYSQMTCHQTKDFEVDSLTAIKFDSVPQKIFCQSALGDITSYKCRTANSVKNYTTEISIYKNVKNDLRKGVDFYSHIINAEEMSALKDNGKILESKDSIWNNLPARFFKIHIIGAGQDNGTMIKNLYIKQREDKVVKLSTYIPFGEMDEVTNAFFTSLTLK